VIAGRRPAVDTTRKTASAMVVVGFPTTVLLTVAVTAGSAGCVVAALCWVGFWTLLSVLALSGPR